MFDLKRQEENLSFPDLSIENTGNHVSDELKPLIKEL